MVFANLLFLYLFLPLNLLFYFLSQKIVYRNLVLVCFSFLFYAWGEPVWVFLLMTSAAFDYMHGRLIERYRGSWVAKAAVVSSLCLNLGLLITFKYSGFLRFLQQKCEQHQLDVMERIPPELEVQIVPLIFDDVLRLVSASIVDRVRQCCNQVLESMLS